MVAHAGFESREGGARLAQRPRHLDRDTIVNPPDDPNKVSAYISGHRIDYPILLDCGQVAFSYVQKSSFDLPGVYLIDGSGMIRNHWEYSPTARDIFEGNGLIPEIDKLMAGSAPQPKKK